MKSVQFDKYENLEFFWEIYHSRFQKLSLSKLEYEIKNLGLQSMMRLLSNDLCMPSRKLICDGRDKSQLWI